MFHAAPVAAGVRGLWPCGACATYSSSSLMLLFIPEQAAWSPLQGFACAFHVLYRTEQQRFEEYSTTWRSLYTVFAAAVSEFDSKTYLEVLCGPAVPCSLPSHSSYACNKLLPRPAACATVLVPVHTPSAPATRVADAMALACSTPCTSSRSEPVQQPALDAPLHNSCVCVCSTITRG